MQLGLRKPLHTWVWQLWVDAVAAIPEDTGKYYPNEDYYSFNLGMNKNQKPDLLRKIKAGYLLYGKNPVLGGLLSIGYKSQNIFLDENRRGEIR